ncbi:MAG: glycosyl hydrolase family 18 protein [Thermaerobacter sp.]|nr:glycosyl hydrolase family 18 protein [Thermaerobacter sp.]
MRPLGRFALPALAIVVLALAILPHVNLPVMAKGTDAYLSPAHAQAAQTAAPGTVPVHQDGLPTPLVIGYYAGAGSGLGFQTLSKDAHLLNAIVPDWYTIWRDGSITGQALPTVLDLARRKNLWVFAMVQQNQYGGTVLGPLLQDPVASRRAMENLLALCEKEGYDGINLDFEGIPPQDRADYTSFVGQLATLLHRYGYYLTLSVPAETANEPTNGWTGAYDYKALGKEADLVLVMAYDEHYSLSAAGPIASTAWVQQVASYAARTMPPRRVVLGVPVYGYDWGNGPAQGLSWEAFKQIAQEHGLSPTSQDLVYWVNGVQHTAYYEGLQAFEAKIRVATGYGIRGIALWRLGLEDPKIWSYLGGA